MRERLLLTKIVALTLSVPLAAIFALLVFDELWFMPRLEQARSVLHQANSEDQAPPPLIVRFLDANEGEDHYWYLARYIVHNTLPQSPPSTNDLNTRTILSVLLLRLHVSKLEALGMYCSVIYVGNSSHGLSSASLRLFHKPLSSLSRDEAATIVVLLRAPAIYEKNPARLARQRDELVSRVAVGP
jgi:hypothetical protein